jgi:HEAT repeats
MTAWAALKLRLSSAMSTEWRQPCVIACAHERERLVRVLGGLVQFQGVDYPLAHLGWAWKLELQGMADRLLHGTASVPAHQRLTVERGRSAANSLDSRPNQRHTPAMRKRLQVTVAVLLVALAGMVAWQVMRPHQREPLYQGKRLSVWLRQYDAPMVGSSAQRRIVNGSLWPKTKARMTAEHAVHQIGTNAIPALLDMLRKTNSPSFRMLFGLWGRSITRISYLPAPVRYPSWYLNHATILNYEARLGFEILGADARQAMPELRTICEQNISSDSQNQAAQALEVIATRLRIPLFMRDVFSTNEAVRYQAVKGLCMVRVEPETVVPALSKSLADNDWLVRSRAAGGLGDFGEAARQAVPSLVELLTDPKQPVREAATNALKQIDPEAAGKAGVR